MIKEAMNCLIENIDLDFISAKEVFDEIFSGLSTSIQASSFITALESKKPTYEEKTAGIISARDAVGKINLGLNNADTIENIIVEQDEKYIDYSLTNDLICSCCNLTALKYCFNARNYSSRSFDILSDLGFKFKNPDFDYSNDIERINFGYICLSVEEPFFKYSWELKNNLKFQNILSLTEKLLNPYNSQNIVLGIKDKNEVQNMAQILIELKSANAIVISGADSLPFVNISGETMIAEAWKNKIFTYSMTAESVDLKSTDIKNIQVENNLHCAQIIKNLTENNVSEDIFNSVILNAGFSLYISKAVPCVLDGIALAKKVIIEGKLKEKFEQLKNFYS